MPNGKGSAVGGADFETLQVYIGQEDAASVRSVGQMWTDTQTALDDVGTKLASPALDTDHVNGQAKIAQYGRAGTFAIPVFYGPTNADTSAFTSGGGPAK